MEKSYPLKGKCPECGTFGNIDLESKGTGIEESELVGRLSDLLEKHFIIKYSCGHIKK